MASNLRYIINSATGTVISANGESNLVNIGVASTLKKPATTKKSAKSSSVGKSCESHQKPAKTRGDELLQLICEWYLNFSDGPVSYTRLYKVSKLMSEKLGLKRLPPRWIDVLREEHEMIIVAMPACLTKPKSPEVVVLENPCLKQNAPKLASTGRGATIQPVDLPERKIDMPPVPRRDTVVVLSHSKKIKKEAKPVVPAVTISRKSVIIKESEAVKTDVKPEAAVNEKGDSKLKFREKELNLPVPKDGKPEDHPRKFRLISSTKISDKDTPDTVLYSTPVIKLELLKK